MTPERHFNFTKQSLQNLLPPDKGATTFLDTKEKGLSVKITSRGTVTFFVRKRVNGRDERLIIGSFPEITIEQARKHAASLKGVLASGKDPIAEKRKNVKNQLTFGQHFHDYLERYSKIHKKSWKYDEREVNKFLTHWFKRKLSDIRRDEIQLLHEKIFKENGLYQANRILERIRAMYNKAIEWGWEGNNPTLGLKKYKEKSRDRFIQPDELPYLFKALNEEHNEIAKDYFLILLLTGARRTNTIMMRWEEINWDHKIWRIPDTKNGEPLILPLLDRAIDILKQRKLRANSAWVFPGDTPDQHFKDPKRPWRRTLKRATIYLWANNEKYRPLVEKVGITESDEFIELKYKRIQEEATRKKIQLPLGLVDVHLHDLRRTLGSYQAISGASLQIIGRSLGHKSIQATQVYSRLILEPVRESLEKATDLIFGI